jgi:hypothetical protein
MSVGRVFLTILKLFLLLVVTAMIKFQIPELRYDFGPKEPAKVESVQELSVERFPQSTFASIRGRADFTKAATFAKYGVRYTYFMLEGYGNKLVVRTSEPVNEQWAGIDFHVGRLRPYRRMPFSRSVRAGFRKHFDLGIPEDALFLARDDAPRPNGWSIGAVSFASVLWLVLAYFFFIHWHIFGARGKSGQAVASGYGASAHHAEPEPAGDQPSDHGASADEDTQ